jgi:hypothetical protein
MSLEDKIKEWAEAYNKFNQAQEADRRFQICQSCPNYSSTILGTWCKICGCNMFMKVHFVASKCPDNPPRW